MESVNIKTLVNQASSDNSDSFRTLYDHLVERVYGYVLQRISGPDAAKEITQDVFVELYKSLPKFSYRSDVEFYAFVFTIAKRQLIRRYREDKKHVASELDDTQAIGTTTDIEGIHAVQSALQELDETSREIIVLHHWSRFTFAEIGKIINMNESAVRVRHHRARATLASILNT